MSESTQNFDELFPARSMRRRARLMAAEKADNPVDQQRIYEELMENQMKAENDIRRNGRPLNMEGTVGTKDEPVWLYTPKEDIPLDLLESPISDEGTDLSAKLISESCDRQKFTEEQAGELIATKNWFRNPTDAVNSIIKENGSNPLIDYFEADSTTTESNDFDMAFGRGA